MPIESSVRLGIPHILSIAKLAQVTHAIRIAWIGISAVDHATLQCLKSLLAVIKPHMCQDRA